MLSDSVELSSSTDKINAKEENAGMKRKPTRRRRSNINKGSRALFRNGLIVSRCKCIKFRRKEKGKNRKRKISTYDKTYTVYGKSASSKPNVSTKRYKKNKNAGDGKSNSMGDNYSMNVSTGEPSITLGGSSIVERFNSEQSSMTPGRTSVIEDAVTVARTTGNPDLKQPSVTFGRASVIENTVTTARITDKLDLKQCSILLAGGYKPPVFAALAVLLDFATVSLFTNGQTVVTGANGRMDALAAYRCIVLMLMSHRERGIHNTFYLDMCKTCNIVHSGKVGHRIDLAKMERNKITGITCEKSKFPGLRWELPEGCVLVVFPSGSYQVAGSRDVDMVMRLDKIVRKTLAKYRIEDSDESDRQRKVNEA